MVSFGLKMDERIWFGCFCFSLFVTSVLMFCFLKGFAFVGLNVYFEAHLSTAIGDGFYTHGLFVACGIF